MSAIHTSAGAVAGAEAQKVTNVKVAVRCRPLNAEEKRTNQPMVVSCDSDKTVSVSYGNPLRKVEKSYAFDKVFGAYSTQEEVFESIVRPIVQEAMDGYNCTVFAYGQTGTGKTHTMEGDLTCADNAGIVPRSVKAIFEQLGESNVEFAIRVSFLELYNEELQDLLSNDSEKKLRLCEDVKKGLICQNLEEIPVLNVNDIFDILQRGIKLRQTAETACNKNSSRSHSIFTMKMFIKESNIDGEEVVRHGQLNLVDLAGSECVGRSGAKNDRAREAGSINQSLLTLGRVITALVDHHGHVPYRDSKLTRLLQESLGGRAKTCIIATLSPSMLAVEETLSTLDYAYRAKNIKNAPQQNQKLVKAVHLQEYSAEIETLRAQLQITREKNGIYLSPADFYAMESRISGLGLQMIECESMIKLRNEEAKASKIAYELLETQMRGVTSELEATSLELKTTKRELSDCQHKLCEVQGELRVSEAVVADKILLESRLRHEGEILQGEVRRCRESIDRLHDKVESYAANEERLIASGQSFVSTLTSEEQRLSNTIKIMLSGSNTCAASISSNITELLVSGKRTCNELNLAVNSALAVLVSQGNTLQLEVGGNLSGLQSHLTQSTADTIQKLQDLQTEVHLSLKHLEERMERSQALLLQHQTQVSGLVVEVREGVSRMSQISSEYSVTQRKHIEEMLVSMVERRSEIERKLAAQEAAMLKERELEVESMRSKAAIIEETMVRQLRELLAAHSSAAATGVASLTVLTGSVRGSMTDFVSSHEAQLHHLQESNTSNHDIILKEKIATEDALRTEEKRLLESMAAQAEEHVFMAKVLQTGRSTFEADLSGMHLYAQETREVNECLVSSASATVSNIQHAVRETSAVLEKSVQGSLAGFNEDMEGSGEMGQEATLQTVAEDTDTYGRMVANGKLASGGNTPMKSPFIALRALPIGRPVETIRAEVLMRTTTPTTQASEGERNTPMSDCNDEGGGLPPVDTENMDPQEEMLANTTALAATELLLPIALSKPDLKKSSSSGNAMNNRSSSRIRAPSSRAN